MIGARVFVFALVTVLAAPRPATGAQWNVQSIPHASFRALSIWAPPPGTPGAFPAVLLLHGNQPGAGSVTAIAGDTLRPLRARPGPLPVPLRDAPLLLVCMTSDDHPHTSCKLNETNLRELSRRGAREAILRKVPGTHAIDFAVVGPVVDDGLRRHGGR